MRQLKSGFALALAVLATWAVAEPAPVTDRSAVFPVEKLSPERRAQAEELLLAALDREGLYTLIGGIKPMSGGWANAEITIGSTTAEAWREGFDGLTDLREALAALHVPGWIEMAAPPFTRDFGNRNLSHAYVFHRPSMKRTITEHAGHFARWGITPNLDFAATLAIIDGDPSPARDFAYGILFGYPRHAVDFFVQARVDQSLSGEFVRREFFQIPSFASETGAFVFAVPVGYEPSDEDLALREKAVAVLEYYRTLREEYIGEGRPGVIELIRDWYHDGAGNYSPQIALEKALAGL